MAEILHQFRLVVYPIIHRVSYISGGSPDFSHQQYVKLTLYFFGVAILIGPCRGPEGYPS